MEVRARTANELYNELWWKIKVSGVTMDSRNGIVETIPEPVLFSLSDPRQRVLDYPVRDCNPFFHIAETVWMLGGSDDVRFVEKFNKRYREYADPGEDYVWGAYGHRWRQHFGIDQIRQAIYQLRNNPDSRQVVIQMWDAHKDLNEEPHNDRPCNTQIMFRTQKTKLDMLVTNRSNDLVWGALGANVVHFTYLHELVANAIGYDVGTYRVLTNNLHVYPGMPRYKEIREEGLAGSDTVGLYPQLTILHPFESSEALLGDCFRFVFEELHSEIPRTPEDYDRWSYDRPFKTMWMNGVAIPMMQAYLAGKKYGREAWLARVKDGWRQVAQDWCARRVG